MNLTRPRPPNQDPTRAQLKIFKISKLKFTFWHRKVIYLSHCLRVSSGAFIFMPNTNNTNTKPVWLTFFGQIYEIRILTFSNIQISLYI